MVAKAVGGGSSAVAASSHAACARFRGTDPLITGMTRRGLAKAVGFHDEFGGIPDARWMRAMTFERLVRDERFASEVATTAVGRLDLARPTAVIVRNARVNVERTAQLLADAHDKAIAHGAATMLHGLAIPFVGFEHERATDVKPDFAVVAPQRPDDAGHASRSWLIIGDAKDYERVRSRIDDARLLKGFLQVALGAESAEHWSKLPPDMDVHEFGVLAVPRNAFLQPEALVEQLRDHPEEVRMRVDERRREASSVQYDERTAVDAHVRHLHATFDPATCTSCTLFAFCRDGLRRSSDPVELLVEIGVPVNERRLMVGLVDGTGVIGKGSASIRAQIAATLQGVAERTGQARIDPAGEPGTVNVVIAKSDSAALGVYGMAVQRMTAAGSGDWQVSTFNDPQSPETRRSIMRVLGRELTAVMKDRRRAHPHEPDPVHLARVAKTELSSSCRAVLTEAHAMRLFCDWGHEGLLRGCCVHPMLATAASAWRRSAPVPRIFSCSVPACALVTSFIRRCRRYIAPTAGVARRRDRRPPPRSAPLGGRAPIGVLPFHGVAAGYRLDYRIYQGRA